ncbi:MAG: hypothetical protein EHM68_06530 [Lysobacterales bacterium]|nr:MAG: hypothetical protein EHM68_06530 [Xanthomonadales bacterium]
MPADPEVALLGNSDRLEEIATLEIAAVVESRSIPLVRLIIGSTGAKKPDRPQQRRNGARLLEHLLAISYPGRAGAWYLSHRASGAPFLERGDDSDPCLDVSASHAGQWAAAALSTAAAVGVDIEQERPGRDTAKLAEFMGWKPRADTYADFYRRWTMWEAYTKSRKGRLFSPAGPEFEGLYAASAGGGNGKPGTWHGFYLQVAEDVHAALVVRTMKPAVTAVHVLDGKQARPW